MSNKKINYDIKFYMLIILMNMYYITNLKFNSFKKNKKIKKYTYKYIILIIINDILIDLILY